MRPWAYAYAWSELVAYMPTPHSNSRARPRAGHTHADPPPHSSASSSLSNPQILQGVPFPFPLSGVEPVLLSLDTKQSPRSPILRDIAWTVEGAEVSGPVRKAANRRIGLFLGVPGRDRTIRH